MARLLFKVEDSFTVRTRGLVIIPGIVPQGDERFRVGGRLELRRPDGVVLNTQILGLEFLNPMPPDYAIAVLLPLGLTTDEVPLGTEVWSV
jgi:hypothetical protein